MKTIVPTRTVSPLTPDEATAAGYWPLTIAYQLTSEEWMLDNALRDLRTAGVPFLLMGEPEAPEIWSGHKRARADYEETLSEGGTYSVRGGKVVRQTAARAS